MSILSGKKILLGVTAGIAAAAVGDFVFPNGDYGKGFNGLGRWTETPSGGESFYGVDRTTSSKLQGVQYSLSGDRKSGLIDAMDTLLDIGDATASVVMVNPLEWATLSKTLEGDVWRKSGQTGDISFPALKLHFAGGTADIIADPFCPQNRGYAFNPDNLRLIYASSSSKMVEMQTNVGPVAGSGDTFSLRMYTYAGLLVKRPNQVLKITFS